MRLPPRLQSATWRLRPPKCQAVAHSDDGARHTSRMFGNRLRHAGLHGFVGSFGDAEDNGVAEAFF